MLPTEQPSEDPTFQPSQQPTITPTQACTAVDISSPDCGDLPVTGVYNEGAAFFNGKSWWQQLEGEAIMLWDEDLLWHIQSSRTKINEDNSGMRFLFPN